MCENDGEKAAVVTESHGCALVSPSSTGKGGDGRRVASMVEGRRRRPEQVMSQNGERWLKPTGIAGTSTAC